MQEIFNDDFWVALHDFSQQAKVVLEIGGATGDGSTTAFKDASDKGVLIYSVEALSDRYQQLNLKPFVTAIYGSTVSAEGYMSEDAMIKFWKEIPTSFSAYSLDFIKQIRNGELELLKQIPNNVIDDIKADFVLIDGSAFTGEAELEKTIANARFITLDDIVDIKNYANFHKLSNSPEWNIIYQNQFLRNGAAIFQRR